MSNLYQVALDELRTVVGRVDDSAVDRACEMISQARKVVVFGGGREGLQIPAALRCASSTWGGTSLWWAI